MSTPRTDAAKIKFKISGGKHDQGIPIEGEWCEAEFTSSLETELQSTEAKLAVMAEALAMVLEHCDADSSGETVFERAVIHARNTVRNLPEHAQRLQEFLDAVKEVADPRSTRGFNYMWEKWRAYQGDSDG